MASAKVLSPIASEILAGIADKKRVLFGVTFHGLHFKVTPELPRKILGKKKGLDFTLSL
jgi:hypothetical protein